MGIPAGGFRLPGSQRSQILQFQRRPLCHQNHDREEVELMHFLLKEYHPYIVERHGRTLLPQYLGMYRLTVDGIENYLFVTRNVFSKRLPLHNKYDLKGSTVERDASDKEKEKELPTLKDNDFLKDGTKIIIGSEAKELLMETLTADVEFLMKLQIMDYSLLLGVHDCDQVVEDNIDVAASGDNENDEDSCDSNAPVEYTGKIVPELDIYAIPCKEDENKKEVYFLALVDILTHYGVKKQAAKAAKTVKYGSHVGISTVEPDQYGRRFLDFMNKIIE